MGAGEEREQQEIDAAVAGQKKQTYA